jgi:hypothetical protein
MAELIEQGNRWWPVIMRGGLWMAIAVLTDFIRVSDEVQPSEMDAWSWIKFGAGLLLSALVAWRTYTDQSLTNHKIKLKAEVDGVEPILPTTGK